MFPDQNIRQAHGAVKTSDIDLMSDGFGLMSSDIESMSDDIGAKSGDIGLMLSDIRSMSDGFAAKSDDMAVKSAVFAAMSGDISLMSDDMGAKPADIGVRRHGLSAWGMKRVKFSWKISSSAKERRSEGAKERRSEGAKERRSEGAKERKFYSPLFRVVNHKLHGVESSGSVGGVNRENKYFFIFFKFSGFLVF
jgi:hypothetical protein